METGQEDVAPVLNSCIWDARSGHASDEQHSGAGESARSQATPNVRFEELYEQYFEFVWRSLRMLGVPEPSLDDAAQDVFGTVARQLPRFEGRSSLRTWVFGIAQFTASNHRRGQRRKAAPLEPLPEGLESQMPGPECEAQAGELREVIVNFCAALDEGRRAVFVLGLLEEVPPLEIAQLLEIPLNTVYSRLRALRQALRLQLERWEESR
ncbi:MAG TPA: sigma-70 family RNA polymerase sigma factor [Polyangiaceae bacterium]|nr:sigma-70 family RNA polymerase sigma factor [Polyangiaceae bacterium]